MSEKIRVIGAIREHNIRIILPDSSLCQNGKQVEIITKMIFELCYIEVIIPNDLHTVFVILPFCLHSALFVCTALKIKHFRSVDTICTQLHSSALCLHCVFVYAFSALRLHRVCTRPARRKSVTGGRRAVRSNRYYYLP